MPRLSSGFFIDFLIFCAKIEIDTLEGVNILSIIIALYFVFSQPHNQIAGVQDIKPDPNHPVEVYYGSTQFQNAQQMASDLGVTIYPEDKIDTFPDPALGLGSKITITRATPVLIIDAKKSNTYRTWQDKVGDLIKEKKIDLLGQDSVAPSTDTAVTYAMQITITRVAEVEIKELQPIAFKTIKKNSVDLEKGQTEIEQKGINGEQEVTYLVKRIDGEEVSRKVTNTQVTKEAQTQIQVVGIGPKLAKSGPYKDTINAAAKQYLINGTALMCLVLAESGGSADAGYPDAPYKGLFQYTDAYWADASAAAGYAGYDIYNAEAQIFSTARALTHGQAGRWPPWSRCANK